MNNKTLLQTLVFLLILGTQGVLHAAPVTVTIQSAVDKNCDGSADTSAKALPGSCIIYTLTVVNNSSAAIDNLNITGEIPKHTTLFQHIWLDHDIFAYPQAYTDVDRTHVNIQLDTLESGRANAIVLQYAVKIAE